MTLRITMRNELGIVTQSGPPYFPNKGRAGYIIFEDPDGCLAMDSLNLTPEEGCPMTRPASDEIYVEFTPDVDDVGLEDNFGNSARRLLSIDFLNGGQTFDAGDGFDTESTIRLGPVTGITRDLPDGGSEEVLDGYSFGADDDIIGLVLIIQHGAGIVYDEQGNRKVPYEVNNMAGFTNSVSYELNSLADKTTITAGIIVPPKLVAPFVVADECVGDPVTCDGDILWSVDGLAPQSADVLTGQPSGTVTNTFEDYTALFDDTLYTISAYMVSGLAPNRVVDMNNNGRIGRADLEAMGYTVLSRRATLRLNQTRGNPCNGGVEEVAYKDFDGNGVAKLGITCPASPVGLSRVPR
ncbi:MAG: hypothetical protein AAF660_12265 [Pseudomonadota bacterium]